MDGTSERQDETYNPWSVVNLVFEHLAAQGLRPILGTGGDPGAAGAELLRTLGITPTAPSSPWNSAQLSDHLAEIRAAIFGEE